jgi:hypothetical protein
VPRRAISFLNRRLSRRFKNLPPFVRFLVVAGQLNGQVVNAQNIAREAAVARSTVDTYFAVLSDTLVGKTAAVPFGIERRQGGAHDRHLLRLAQLLR